MTERKGNHARRPDGGQRPNRAWPVKGFLLVLLFLLLSPAPAQLQVAVISDLNGSYGSTEYGQEVDDAVARILALQPDLVISTGDMVAGQRPSPLLKGAELERMWQSFHRHVTWPLKAQGLPLAVTPGNHDASVYGDYHREREYYARTWRERRNSPPLDFIDDRHYPFYYAFAMDRVLFVSLDATANGGLDPRQKQWLRELLETQGAQYRHRIVFSHLPLWPVARGRETGALFDDELEQLLQQQHVTLYFSGHHHAYYPGYKDGVRYVSQACLGAGPRRLIGERERSPRSITLLTIPDEGPPRVTAWSGRHFDRLLDIRKLPKAIRSKHATLIREDLALPRLKGN